MAEIEKDPEKASTTLEYQNNEITFSRIDDNDINKDREKNLLDEIEKISFRRETIVNGTTEVIILDVAPTVRDDTRSIVKNGYNPRVIELSDKISKMELHREFKVDATNPVHSAGETSDSRRNVGNNDDDSAEILSRLPPGTILIKQNSSGGSNPKTRSCSREDSDYVHDSSKDSTETNSSGSSSAASYAPAGKVKRMQHRTSRSKKIVEVRRNPVRNKKKKPIDEDFPRPRQRLLSVKRKARFVVDTVARKRVKTAPTPYMNTRSVTRKMYTVGATYQAPTIHDAIEWKEWPSHGMHERPIWHPQFGLAYQYNDRNFVSLDGRTYREIIDEPVIEVVSVDPHPERLLFSDDERKIEKIRRNNFLERLETVEACAIERGKSFEACMHGSLHSVLAYCSRIVTPDYKKNVSSKFRCNSEILDSFDNDKAFELSNDVSMVYREEKKITLPSTAFGKKIMIPTNSQLPIANTTEVSKCSVVPRRTISFTNVKNMHGNILQEVFNRSSKNTLIFLKPTDPPIKTEKIINKTSFSKLNHTIVKDNTGTPTTEMNLTKLDDNTISDEALMEMSSIYKKLIPNDKTEATSMNLSKVPIDTSRPVTADVKMKLSNISGIDDNRAGPFHTDITRTSRFASSNQAAEIAKILAEYNENAANNSRTKKARYPPSSVKAASVKTIKFDKEFNNIKDNRERHLALVHQPIDVTLKRNEVDVNKSAYRQNCILPNQDNKGTFEAGDKTILTKIPIKTETVVKDIDDNSRAMDLTTGKSRTPNEETIPKRNADESMNKQWLQELIEDTALLYCAAAGVHQNDVADYLNTLDSSQSIEWLGS